MHNSKYLKEINAEIYPTIMASTIPSGILEEESYWFFTNKMLESLEKAGPLDGIILHLHGAMEVENIGSGELMLLKKIRQLLGFKIPIGIVLDAHANNSRELCKYVNIIRGYHTIPHHDQPEAEIEVTKQIIELINSKEIVTPQINIIPAIIAGEKGLTEKAPLNRLVKKANELGNQEGIFSASIFMGEPWGDSPNSNMSVIVNPKKNIYIEKAKKLSKELALLTFEAIDEFVFEVPTLKPKESLNLALSQKETPVFISDSGDNTTGGALGEGTEMLRLILNHKDIDNRKILITPIFDLKAYNECNKYKFGDKISLSIGTNRDETSIPITITGILKSKGDLLGYLNCDGDICGQCYTISIKNLDIQISNIATSFITPNHFIFAKTPINEYEIIVLKQGYLFSQLRPFAKFATMAVTKGATYQYIEELEYKRLTHPIFPFDKIDKSMIR